MDPERATVSWRRFFVLLSGVTNGAHSALVAKLKSIGQIEVSSVEDSDYILLFTPSTSQLLTEFSEASAGITVAANTQILLVVIHHGSNPSQVTATSKVNNPRVHLVVDLVFDEGRLLDCRLNNTAWRGIKTFLNTQKSKISVLPPTTESAAAGLLTARTGLAPSYISDVLIPYEPAPSLRSPGGDLVVVPKGTNKNVRENRICTTKKVIAFLIGFVIGLTAVILITQLT